MKSKRKERLIDWMEEAERLLVEAEVAIALARDFVTHCEGLILDDTK